MMGFQSAKSYGKVGLSAHTQMNETLLFFDHRMYVKSKHENMHWHRTAAWLYWSYDVLASFSIDGWICKDASPMSKDRQLRSMHFHLNAFRWIFFIVEMLCSLVFMTRRGSDKSESSWMAAREHFAGFSIRKACSACWRDGRVDEWDGEQREKLRSYP